MAETIASDAGETLPHSRIERARQTLGRLALHALGGTIIALPLAATYGLTHAEVKDHAGVLPVTVTAAPGHSSLDMGILGTIYKKDAANGYVGANIEVEGLPSGLERLKDGDARAFAEPFIGIYQNPDATAEGYGYALAQSMKDEAVKAELLVALEVALLGFLADRASQFKSRRVLKFSMVGASVVSLSLSVVLLEDWKQSHTIPEATYEINGIDQSWADGVVASSPEMANVGKQAITILEDIKTREDARNQQFLEAGYRGVDQLIVSDAFVPPDEGEVVMLALSDIHSNLNMIRVYTYLVDAINEKYGEDTITLTVLAGDQTYGSSLEKRAVEEIGGISEEVVGIEGNHDGSIAKENQRAAGIELFEGNTTPTDAGPSILGDSDPVLTDIGALFGNGENRSRDGNDITQEELGQQLKETAEETNPTILDLHEAYSLEPILDKDDISKATMEEWLAQPPLVHEVPAAAIIYGHWHRDMQSRQLIQPDGSRSVVIELGSAGGAPSSITPSIASSPWTVPAQTASATFITVNLAENKVTKIQEFTTQTDGTPTFEPVERIIQPVDSDNIIDFGQPAAPAINKK